MPENNKPPPGLLNALALVGTLGLVLAAPVVVGVAAGVALDRLAGTRVAFTILGTVGGVAAGFYAAWRLLARSLPPPRR